MSCPIVIPLQVKSGELLLKDPENCPHSYAELMKRCWDLRIEERPSTKEVVEYLSDESNKKEITNYDINKPVFRT